MEDVKSLLTGLGVIGIIILIPLLLILLVSVWPGLLNWIVWSAFALIFLSLAYLLGSVIRGR